MLRYIKGPTEWQGKQQAATICLEDDDHLLLSQMNLVAPGLISCNSIPSLLLPQPGCHAASFAAFCNA